MPAPAVPAAAPASRQDLVAHPRPDQGPAGGGRVEGQDIIPPRTTVLPDGGVRRERLVRAPGKYPLLHVLETFRHGSGGSEVPLSREESVADHVLLTCAPGVDASALLRLAGIAGVQAQRRIGGSRTWLVGIPVGDAAARQRILARLASLQGVQSAGVDQVVRIAATPDDPQFGGCWGLLNTGQSGGTPGADIGAVTAWDSGTGSRAVRVAVIDTGIDYNHPDLAANMWTNPGETGTDALGRDRRSNGIDDDGDGYVDDWRGWDFANDDNDPIDDHGHGTHCAGTIGAVGGNGVGVAGVCWQVSLVPLKFLGARGSGYVSDAVAALDYARHLGIPIASNSWGSQGYDAALDTACQEATAGGMLVVAAAGNNGTDDDVQPFYPAALASDGIIAVAATDRNDRIASFSCFGSRSVDLGAPGVDILSCAPGGGYRLLSGTSMATPHVAGAAALLMALRPQWSAAQVKASLLANVRPLADLAGRSVSGGRLDLGGSVLATAGALVRLSGWTLSDAPADGAVGNGDGVFEPGETVAIRVRVTNTGNAAVTASTVSIQLPPSSSGQIIRGSVTLGPVAAGAQASSLQPLLVRIADGTPPQSVLSCLASVWASNGATAGGSIGIGVRVRATVSGHVFSATSGSDAPVVGATVTWSGGVSGSVVTDGQGRFSFVVLDGDYTLQAVAPGIAAGVPVFVTVPPDRSIDFRLGLPDVGISPSIVAISAPQGGTGHAQFTVENRRATSLSASVLPATGSRVTTSGLWHQAGDLSVVGAGSWYYGRDAEHDYDTGARTSGALVFEDVLVPEGAGGLVWWSRRSCGGLATSDVCLVQVSTDRGRTWTTRAQVTDNTDTWTFNGASIDDFSGSRIWVRFWFDSIDGDDNRHPGWRVDQVAIRSSSQDHIIGLLAASPAVATIPPGGHATFDIAASCEDVWGAGVVTESLRLAVDDGSISELDIPVTVEVRPALVLGASITTFWDQGGGDGDWHAEAGEQVTPSILIANHGSGSTSGGQGTLSISDPYVTVAQGSVAIPAIAPYANIGIGGPLSLVISADCPADRLITGSFRVQDADGGDVTMAVSFRVAATWILSGTVTAADGATPVAGASISNGPKTVSSDSAGRYRLAGLHPGNQLILVSAAGFGSRQETHSANAPRWDVILGRPVLEPPPPVITVTVAPGQSTTAVVPIGNAATSDLDWSLNQPIDGYDVATSDQAGGPEFAWRDIAASGCELRELQQVSYSTGPYPLGMPFPFFDEIRSQAYACPYGYLSLSSRESRTDYTALPSPTAPADLIAWLWRVQWFLDAGVPYAELVDSDTFMLQYDRVYFGQSGVLGNSQVVLARDGTITCRYRTYPAGLECAVGIQNADRSRAAMATADGGGVKDGYAVQFRPRSGWLRIADRHGLVGAGQRASARLLIDASGLATGTYSRPMALHTNAVNGQDLAFTVRLVVVPPAPDIAVEGNGILIACGDATPDPADGTAFGSVAHGSTATRSFTIRNPGTADLALRGTPAVAISGGGASDFSVLTPPAAIVPPGGATTFTLRFSGSSRGVRSAGISIASSVGGKDPYAFAVAAEMLNAPPSAADDSCTTASGTILVVASPGVLANDGDPDGDAITAQIEEPPAHGVLGLDPDGGFTYLPDAGFVGSDGFSYRAGDGLEHSPSARVAIRVEGPVPLVEGQGEPIAAGDAAPRLEDGTDFGAAAPAGTVDRSFTIRNAGTLDLVLAAAEPVGVSGPDAAAFTIISQPPGRVPPGGSGVFTVRYTAGGQGVLTATVSLATGIVGVGPYRFAIQAECENQAPVADADGYAVAAGIPLVVAAPGILANDQDPNGDELTVRLVDPPAHGVLALSADGAFVYTPGPGFIGLDGFSYRATDASADSTVAMVELRVDGPDLQVEGCGEAIVAGDATPDLVDGTDFGSVMRGESIERSFVIRSQGTLALAFPAGDPVSLGGPAAGAFSIVAQPPATIPVGGVAAFTVRFVAPGPGDSTAVVSIATGVVGKDPYCFAIRAACGNRAPETAPDAYATAAGTTLVMAAPGILANDADPDGDACRTRLLDQPRHGRILLAADGGFEYSPAPGFTGADSFIYLAEDGRGGSAPGMATITVLADQTGEADGPSASGGGSCGSGLVGAVAALLILVAFAHRRR